VIGNDGDSRFLADAIPAAINNQLVNLGFQVVSPAIAFQYRGERKAQAGKELGPRYVIDGSVRVDGGRLQVIARVDSVSRPISVWSRTFETELRDTSQLPDRIAIAIAGLQLFAASTRGAQFVNAPEVVAGAQRWSEAMRTGDDMGAYLLAKGLLREMPNVFTYQINYGISVGAAIDMIPASERAEALAEARRVVASAASMTPVGSPYATQSLLPTVDWESREHALRKGADTYTSYSSFRYALAVLLSHAGRVKEAASFAHEATSMDPLSSTHILTYAGILDTEGKYEAADVLYSRAERLWPNLEPLTLLRFPSALLRDDLKSASAMLSDAATEKILNPPAEQRPYSAILRALSTHNSNDIAAVERECSDPLKQARRRSAPCLVALIKLDRLDTLFSLSTKYFPEQRGASATERDARWLDNPLAWRNLRLLFRADMAAIRTDARIIPIFDRMGLIDYWRATHKWPDFCATEPKSVCAQMRSH
ncbi:MAG TPA: hypothetical protein VK629_03410, partial [Steroidobacteraceae bacterium]|nr:hypothetical protein [Steroidobacteraceae bacterium]